MDQVTGTVTPTRLDYARALQQAVRPMRLRVLVAGGLVAGLGLAGGALDRTKGWIVVVAFGVALVVNSFRIGSALARRLTGAALGPHTYSVGDYGIRIRSEVAFSEISWQGIGSVDRMPDAWVLRPASKQPPLLIFRKAFDSGQDKQFADILRQRGLLGT